MKVHTSFKRMEPDTISGESIVLTTVYSSFDSAEIDKLEEQFRKRIGSGIIGEVNLDDEEDE